jgi:hypothetical protein
MRLALATGPVLVAIFIVGCGGGGDRLSKDEFQKQASATCAKYEQKLNAIGTPTSPADISNYVEKGVPVIQQGLVELRRLKPPADMQADYDRMLAEVEKSIPAARRLAAAAAKQDAAGVQKALKEGQAASDASDDIAKTLGLSGCVSG